MVKITTWLAAIFFLLAVLLDFNPPERKVTDLGGLESEMQLPAGEVATDAPVEESQPATADDDLLGDLPVSSQNAPLGTGGTESE